MGKGKAPADPHKPAVVKNRAAKQNNDNSSGDSEEDADAKKVAIETVNNQDKKINKSEKGSTPSIPEKVAKGPGESVA